MVLILTKWNVAARTWQIKLSVMYVYVLAFYIICSLTYFHIKVFVRAAKQLYWNNTLARVFSCKFAADIQNTFS